MEMSLHHHYKMANYEMSQNKKKKRKSVEFPVHFISTPSLEKSPQGSVKMVNVCCNPGQNIFFSLYSSSRHLRDLGEKRINREREEKRKMGVRARICAYSLRSAAVVSVVHLRAGRPH